MDSPNPSSWKQCYQSALDERDPAKIEDKVYVAEAAIFLRRQEFSFHSDHEAEDEEMKQASQRLLRLKTERTGWPKIKS
jgi:hypothetical protein